MDRTETQMSHYQIPEICSTSSEEPFITQMPVSHCKICTVWYILLIINLKLLMHYRFHIFDHSTT